MTIPKTPKGISNRITKIRSQLSAFKREYGFIDDGGGARYYLFYLYFLLGDNRRSSEYIRWFQKDFPDDSGEPFALLCWALILHRMGKDGNYILARTMLSNIYLLPHLLGEEMPEEIPHSSNWNGADFLEYTPERILEAITDDDLSWIRERFHSERFQKVLNRHIEIEKELEDTPRGDRRSALVHELYSLLDGWR
ncbi:hypothetical protein [Spirochaeta isovalerica]|uniref:Uncharacterized protein n=1 Tax=Spirochaeta isovalerica TaxID=150 RepID=A0A841REV3_9SPIO|nr:hypothetical protein [Spirochaeta isovalerica]MBB6481530.1 hypothetical protein [Spirochaeta isovalerica]